MKNDAIKIGVYIIEYTLEIYRWDMKILLKITFKCESSMFGVSDKIWYLKISNHLNQLFTNRSSGVGTNIGEFYTTDKRK